MEYAEVLTYKNGDTDRYSYESLDYVMDIYQEDISMLTTCTSITIESRLNKNEKWKPLFRFNRKNQEVYNKWLTQNI